MRSDAAGERRRHAGAIEIELSVVNCGLRVINGCLSRLLVCGALVRVLDRSEATLLQRVGAPGLKSGQFELGACGLELRRRLVQLDLVRSGVDLKEEVALRDDVTVLECDLVQGAADLRPEFHLLYGGELAEKQKAPLDILLGRNADGDRRRKWCRSLRRVAQIGRPEDNAGPEEAQGGSGSQPCLHARHRFA